MVTTPTTFLYGPRVTKRFKRTLALDLTATQEHLVVERGSSLARGSVIVTTCARTMIASSKAGDKLDTIIVTGSGGDPVLHPDLREVTENLRTLRDKWFSRAKLYITTGVTDLENEEMRACLAMYDGVLMRYQWGNAKAFAKATGAKATQLGPLTSRLTQLDHLIVEASFFKGGNANASDKDVASWVKKIEEIAPQEVHVISGTGGEPKPAKGLTAKQLQAVCDALSEKTGLVATLHEEEPLLT